jgi:hypothetical protein
MGKQQSRRGRAGLSRFVPSERLRLEPRPARFPRGSGSAGNRFDFSRLNNALARGAEPVKSNETAA